MLNSVRRFSSHVCKEVTFPVPWGVIAGKQWTSVGDACAASVQWVALHGYLDSAASFDQLAPLLTSASPGHAVLALDYPGHGRSSPLAPGQMYHLLECVKFVRIGG